MNIRHLTFRLLQVYVAVIKTGSISQAAAQLHLSQPTVSQQIKRLSDAVGQPLFGHGYEPTFVGLELYHAALDAFARFEAFNHVLSEAKGGLQGTLNIGIVTTAQYLMPQLLSAFYQQYPNIDVKLHIANRSTILQRFHHQQDDFYIFSHPPTDGNVLSARFLLNPLALIAPKGHWSEGKKVSFKSLQGERFIIREQGSATRMVFDNWLREHSYTLDKTLQVESNEVIRMSVEKGMGLAVLSEHALSATHAQVNFINTPHFPLKSHWYLVRHKDIALSQTAKNFASYLNVELANLVDEKYINNQLKAIL